jgi:Ca-activated chloride channel homolog
MSQALSVFQSLTFEQPLVLWLIALAVPLIVLVPAARLRVTTVPLRLSIWLLRLAIVGLLVACLAEPTLRPAGHARAVVFALDVSDSISSDQKQWARAWVDNAIRALPPGSHADTIEFGERALLAGFGVPLPTAATDLGAALRMASALLPREAAAAPEIVLLTDGWHTAATPATDPIPSGIAVSFVPLPLSPQQPVAVVHGLSTPPVARVGERIDLSIDVQSAQPVDAQLRIWLDQVPIADGPIHLETGDTHLSVPRRVEATGSLLLTVRVELNVGEMSSALASVVVVKPAGRVLVLEDEPGQADNLVSLLEREGLEIERQPSSFLPPSADALSSFDGVVLVNTPATNLTLDQQRTLQSFVQDLGRGLLVVGGARTFSPGAYQGSVLDELLPISSEPPIEPQQGSLALILVLDRSGSMDVLSGGGSASGGASKLSMARQAAIEAAGLLQPQDTLGVIAFDSGFQWVVPPTKLRGPDDVRRAQTLISAIKPGGGTSILAPLEAAYQAAASTDAPLKHIVLLTDGESNDRGYEELIERMRPAQITLSALAIGSDSDTRLLSGLARLGGGRYYFTERAAQIPRIASKETTILTRNAVVEGQVAAVVAEPSPILRSVAGDLPPLSGYVATTRKDRAVTALETERGHPLLAHWQYGLGRVVVWTSEAQSGWASGWANWSAASQFWSQAVRWSLPAPVHADFQPTVGVGPDGRQVSLQVQALRNDGRFAELQDTRATVVSPDGSAREVGLPQRGPGSYGIDTRVSLPGIYRVLFEQGAREEVGAFSVPDAIELHSVGVNHALLDLLARTTGGHQLTDPTEAARPANGAGPAIEPWPWLLLAALVLLPLDVYLRRRA